MSPALIKRNEQVEKTIPMGRAAARVEETPGLEVA